MRPHRKRGFSLVELLVTLAIIALLASIVQVSLKSVRTKAAEARRAGDVKALVTAFNVALEVNGNKMPSSGGKVVCLGTTGTCWNGTPVGSDTVNSFFLTGMKQIPADPTRTSGVGDRYLYADNTDSVAYHCTGAATPHGPFIIWEPENTSPHADSLCQANGAYYACCETGYACGGTSDGANGSYFCVLPLNY